MNTMVYDIEPHSEPFTYRGLDCDMSSDEMYEYLSNEITRRYGIQPSGFKFTILEDENDGCV